MTAPLVEELREEVAGLVERVRAQVDEPTVQPLGLLHTGSASLTVRVSSTASIDTIVKRGSDLAEEPGERS